MNKFFEWLSTKIAPYLSESYLLSMSLTEIISIDKSDSMIFIFNESTPPDVLDLFSVEIKRILPDDKFIILASDSPVRAIRIT